MKLNLHYVTSTVSPLRSERGCVIDTVSVQMHELWFSLEGHEPYKVKVSPQQEKQVKWRFDEVCKVRKTSRMMMQQDAIMQSISVHSSILQGGYTYTVQLYVHMSYINIDIYCVHMMQTARLPQISHKSGDAMIKCFELESDVSVAALRTQAVKHSGAEHGR